MCGPHLADLSILSKYDLWTCWLLTYDGADLNFLQNSPNLLQVAVRDAPQLIDISVLADKNIKTLVISRTPLLKNFEPLKQLNPEVLILTGNPNISDLSFLENMKNLRFLDLSDDPLITDISILQKLPCLESVNLTNTNVRNIEVLNDKKLKSLEFRNSDKNNGKQ